MPPVIQWIGAKIVAIGLHAGLSLGAAAFIAEGILYIGGTYLLNAVSKMLTKSPRGSDFQNEAIRRLNSVRGGASEPRRVIYGKCRVGGNIVAPPTSGDANKFLHLVVALAGHQCEAIDEVWFGETKLNFTGSDGSATNSEYKDPDDDHALVYVKKHLGASDQTVDTVLDAALTTWTSDHRLRGICYLHVRLEYNQQRLAQIPSITAVVRGKNDIYDFRTSTTGYTTNAALIVADYLMDSTIGLGYAQTDIDEDQIKAAANVCDESVNLNGGGTEKRYTCNGTFQLSAPPKSILEKMLTAMAGKMADPGGKWFIFAGAYQTPASSALTESDLRAGYSVKTKPSKRDNCNAVRGIYANPDANWQPDDFPAVTNSTYETEDGEQVWRDIELPFTTSSATAQRLAKIELERTRQGIVLSFPVNLTGYRFQEGDNVKVTLPRMGWEDKVFEILSAPLAIENKDGSVAFGCDLLLQETASTIWDWASGEETTVDPAPDTDLPDPNYVPPPTSLAVTSGTNELIQKEDGTILSRAKLAWTAPIGTFAQRIRIQYKKNADSTWIEAGIIPISATQHWIVEVEDGTAYDFRVQALNAVGRESAWETVTSHTVVGKSADPSVPTGLSVTARPGGLEIEWTQITDLDRYRTEIQFDTASDFSSSPTILSVNWDGNPYTIPHLTAGTTYHVRVRSVDTSGNTSDWSGSVRGVPEALRYYIKPTDGTAIKNSSGTLTIEAHQVSGGADVLLSSGTIKLYDPSDKEITVANGYATGSDGYTGVFDSGDIDGSKVITLKDGASGTPLDTITLLDITDGADAIMGHIEPSGSLASVKQKDGTWAPPSTTLDLDCTFYLKGMAVARVARRITRTDAGSLSHAATTHKHADGDLNADRVSVDSLGDDTTTLTVGFHYNHDGHDLWVYETVLAVRDGDDTIVGNFDGGFREWAWTRDSNGNWNPDGTTYDFDATFSRGGDVLARRAVRITRDNNGNLSVSNTTHTQGDLNTGRVSYIRSQHPQQQNRIAILFLYSDGTNANSRFLGCSAYTIIAPPDAVLHYIKPTDGTAIKNSSGTLTIEAHKLAAGVDTLLSSGTIKLYDPSDNEITVANGYATGSDGYTGVLDANDIGGAKVITLKDGTSGDPLDTITLADVFDGGDPPIGWIEPSGPLAWTRAPNAGAWSPSETFLDLDVYFQQANADVARIAHRITRSAAGVLTGASTTHKDTNLNTSRVTVTEINESTSSMSVKFAYSHGGFSFAVVETVLTSEGGSDGADGADGANGANGATGPTGPGLLFRGPYSSSTVYYHDSTRRDVVSYSSNYYIVNNTSKNGLSTWSTPTASNSDWSQLSNFESVATDILLAQDAAILKTLTIGESGSTNGIIKSYDFSDTSGSEAGWQLKKGSLKMYDGIIKIQDSNQRTIIEPGLQVTGTLADGSLSSPGASGGNLPRAYLSVQAASPTQPAVVGVFRAESPDETDSQEIQMVASNHNSGGIARYTRIMFIDDLTNMILLQAGSSGNNGIRTNGLPIQVRSSIFGGSVLAELDGNGNLEFASKLTAQGDQYTWPTSKPSTGGYVLTSSTTGVLTWTAKGSGYMTDLSDDTSPELGGDLDADDNDITDVGELGIGTTSPATALHISKSTAKLRIQDSDGTNQYTDLHHNATAFYLTARNGSSDAAMYFRQYDGTSLTYPLMISSAGRVGIGTTTPGYPLSVNGNAWFGSHIVINTTTVHPGVGSSGSVGGAHFEAASTASNGTTLLVNRKDNTPLHLNTNGDRAIQLIRRSGTVVGSISVTSTATAYNTTSDRRLKENLVPLADAIERVKKLKIYRFNFKADPSKVVDGLIADEAQQVVPEAVTGQPNQVKTVTKEVDGVTKEVEKPVYQGIDQAKLVPLLAQGLKDSFKIIESLETRITTLETE